MDMTITCVLLSILVVVSGHFYSLLRRFHNMPTHSSMLAVMSMSSMNALIAGTMLPLTQSFFVSCLLAIFIGVLTGVLSGALFHLLCIIEGIISGVMAGLMGAMLGVMLPPSLALFIVLIFIILWLVCAVLFSYYVANHQPPPSAKASATWPVIITTISMSIILVTITLFNESPVYFNDHPHEHSASESETET